jgi:hypothetical protein
MRTLLTMMGVVLMAANLSAQTRPPVTPVAPTPETPMTAADRVGWVVDGNVSPRSLAAGVVVAGWNTAINSPPEWERRWSGYGKRYMAREINLATSNGLEAGVGALWDEDPRYVRERSGRITSRVSHAVRTAFTARRHGAEIPAYARYTATVGAAFIAEAWLPPSASRPRDRTLRIAGAFVGRSLANLWVEFWPDIRARLHH